MTELDRPLLLSGDVHYCYYYDDVVVLRLAANTYSRLSESAATVLHQLCKSLPPQGTASGGVVDSLVAQGVLTREGGRPVAPTLSAMPVEHLVETAPATTPRIRLAHAAAFLWAAATATLELALVARLGKGFDGPVRRILLRNARLREAAPGEARELAAVFDELRIFWPRRYLCRFDSLALVHFLACFGVRARWVFGVRLDPFYAHCWVQDDRRLYNDDLERIAQYQPIMVVG